MDIRGLTKPIKYLTKTNPYKRRTTCIKVYGNSEVVLNQSNYGLYDYKSYRSTLIDMRIRFLEKQTQLDDVRTRMIASQNK